MARSELFAGIEVGETKRVLGHDLAAIGERDEDAWLLECRQLEFDPGADVVDRGSQPRVHRAPILREIEGRKPSRERGTGTTGRLCPYAGFEDWMLQ